MRFLNENFLDKELGVETLLAVPAQYRQNNLHVNEQAALSIDGPVKEQLSLLIDKLRAFDKGAITSTIKHAIKHKTSPARPVQLDGTPSLAAS